MANRKWIMLMLALLAGAAESRGASTNAGIIDIRGAIGPATATYIARAIGVAAARQDACLIIRLDTPGGLLDSTKDIVQAFYASPLPVVVYVAPSGARAASAGTFITMAADIAAMAPNTTIGAAHPVALSFGGGDEKEESSVMKDKMENASASDIEAIAQKRGRNADWAKSAVRESASITAEKALELNVIDLIATDIPDLLQKMDGREVNGKVLKTAGADVVAIPRVMGERFFQMIWRPEVMLLLMLVAIYGIIGEINHPGAIFPGVVGAIALLLFLYMTTILPINVAGVALIVLAVVLFVLELYTPTSGVLTVGAIVSFFLGGLMLFTRSAPGFNLPVAYVVGATAVTALFFAFVVGAGLRAQLLPVRAGRETLLGKVVPAIEPITAQSGRVFVEGEYWNAVSEVPVAKDEPVQIVGVEGLTLKVKPNQS